MSRRPLPSFWRRPPIQLGRLTPINSPPLLGWGWGSVGERSSSLETRVCSRAALAKGGRVGYAHCMHT
eukprot:15249969-Alexandrium_andersonii.AAC.1